MLYPLCAAPFERLEKSPAFGIIARVYLHRLTGNSVFRSARNDRLLFALVPPLPRCHSWIFRTVIALDLLSLVLLRMLGRGRVCAPDAYYEHQPLSLSHSPCYQAVQSRAQRIV